MKRIIALSVGLWAASWSEAEDAVQQMLPLAVGNRWDYQHIFIDRTINTRLEQDVTISITHTEDIEEHTYYVFSDMPYEVSSVPYFFLAGKKVRWEDNHLLFRQQDRDVALYQFGDQEFYEYVIPEMVSDTLVESLIKCFVFLFCDLFCCYICFYTCNKRGGSMRWLTNLVFQTLRTFPRRKPLAKSVF